MFKGDGKGNRNSYSLKLDLQLFAGGADNVPLALPSPTNINTTKPVVSVKPPAPTIDRNTGFEVQRFIADDKGNIMLEPAGGSTIWRGDDMHTLYPNGSNYQRFNPKGHPNNPVPHAHGHQMGTGPNMRGQGPSIDVNGNVVPWASANAHWRVNP